MKKNKNGITLIALVITIIVLLILAGISISLVTGQNGVLTRAEDASSTYSMASAKEQANMRAAGYVSEYMEKVYVDNDLTVGSMTTGEYVLSQINGEEDGDYRYSVSGSTITVTSKTTGETLASGTVDDNGGISWSDSVASGENTDNSNTNTSTNNQGNTNTQENNNEQSEPAEVEVLAAEELPNPVDAESSLYVVYNAGKDIEDEITYNGKTNKILCRVLYNDNEHGLQLIAVNPVEDVTIGVKTTNSNGESFNFKQAIRSYNSAIQTLNNRASAYLDDDGIAVDARSVGSKPSTHEMRFFDKKNEGSTFTHNNASCFEFLDKYKTDGTKGTDSNYVEDETRLKNIGAYGFTKTANGGNPQNTDAYWLASCNVNLKREDEDWGTQYSGYFSVRRVTFAGERYAWLIWTQRQIAGDSKVYSMSNEITYGLRPVFLIGENAKLVINNKDGSIENPYELKN